MDYRKGAITKSDTPVNPIPDHQTTINLQTHNSENKYSLF